MKKMFFLGAFFGLSACGGGSVDLGVKSSKQLADLDDQESCDLFVGITEYTTESFELSCYLVAQAQSIVAADFEATCDAAFDACMAQMNGFDEPLDCATVENNIPADCDATVGDVEACLSDTLDIYEDAASAKCDRPLDLTDLEALQGEFESPASCDLGPSCGTFF